MSRQLGTDPFAAQRPADPESLRRVVQSEADDQRHGEADLVRRRGLADGEALAEVVDADADRDQEREPDRRDSSGRAAGGSSNSSMAAAPGPTSGEDRRPARAFIHAS